RVSYSDLTSDVSRAAQALAQLGLRAGDRAAAFIPNLPDTGMRALAALSQGIVWSSCSPDFGVQGVIDRFGQIEPKVLIACDGYYYAGKEIDLADKLASILPRLPSVESVIIASYLGRAEAAVARLKAGSASRGQHITTWRELVSARPACEPEF